MGSTEKAKASSSAPATARGAEKKGKRPAPEPRSGMKPLPDSPTLADGISSWNDFQRQPFIKGRSNTEASQYWRQYQAAGRKGGGEKDKKSNGAKEERKAPAKTKPKP